jgi:hypothetical protein
MEGGGKTVAMKSKGTCHFQVGKTKHNPNSKIKINLYYVNLGEMFCPQRQLEQLAFSTPIFSVCPEAICGID